MTRTLTTLLAVSTLALAGLAPGYALAADWQDFDLADRIYEKYKERKDKEKRDRDDVREDFRPAAISLDQAVNIVRRQTDGKVIGASTSRSGSRVVHRVKVLQKNGRVRTFRVDGQSGSVN